MLASAENGLQINVLGVKFFDREKDSERIAGTMLHEFMHILDGTYPVPSDYDTITQSDYVGDKYAQSGNDYMELGFVSKYARSSPAEDIAETGGRLISMSEEEWEAMLSSIESADAPKSRRSARFSSHGSATILAWTLRSGATSTCAVFPNSETSTGRILKIKLNV